MMDKKLEIAKTLSTLFESLVSTNVKVTITIEPNNGLTGSEVEKARAAGREGKEIQF